MVLSWQVEKEDKFYKNIICSFNLSNDLTNMIQTTDLNKVGKP